MKIAEKFGRPVITFLDTPGAYPGIDAEERGQAEAIALNLREMARLRVPVITIVIGEGGSGGALGSWLAALILVLPVLRRAALEDRVLREQLEGYAAYARQVRYRMFPGVW